MGRLQSCGRVPVGEAVELAHRDGDRAHWSGLATCGSVHACPVCAERIWARRQLELRSLLEAAHAEGLTVSMLTFTVRHRLGDGLAAQLDALNDAWAAAQRSTATARAKRDAGYVGMVRRLEITDGAHGWHPHLHALVIHAEPGHAKLLGATMHRAYTARLKRHNADSWATAGGLDARELTLSEALGEVASYVTKGGLEALQEDGGPVAAASDDDLARAAARELSGGRAKKGRRAGRSPWQLLDQAAAGDLASSARWHEYERATKGRRALTWTNGLRERFGITAEATDEQIAAENDGEQVAVAMFSPAAWGMIRRDHAAMIDLLEVVETAEPSRRFDAVVAYLAARRIPAVPWRPEQLMPGTRDTGCRCEPAASISG